jgi:hypothetical protein
LESNALDKNIKAVKAGAVAVAMLILCPPTFAKDHSTEYKMGTLMLVPMRVEGKQKTSYTDTTDCHDSPFGLQCSGGIVDNYDGWLVADMPDGTKMAIQRCAGGATAAALFLPCDIASVPVLTEEDGTVVFLHHPWGYHDSTTELAATSKVLYRVEHKLGAPGVTYIKIPDPANPKKEGTYWVAFTRQRHCHVQLGEVVGCLANQILHGRKIKMTCLTP